MSDEANVKMVVVDGVRYRPEDAPKGDGGTAQHKARKPAAKAESSAPTSPEGDSK